MYASLALGQEAALGSWLAKFAFGWNVWGSWGVPLGVMCIWWPAWMVAAIVVASSWFPSADVPVQATIDGPAKEPSS